MGLITWMGWATTLLLFAGLALAMVPLSSALFEKRFDGGSEPQISVRNALTEALGHRGFWLLSLGFFVCGFQVVFIGIHLPAFLLDQKFAPAVGTTVLALIGLFNIIGTYLAGYWGGHYRKPRLLSAIYAGRAVVIAAFVYFPTTAASAYAFGIAMGLLWLSTVPLTNGTVAVIFGVRNMSMLGGVVFLFHQIGAFLGGWLGGYMYDQTGSYDSVWLMAIALSGVAMLLNLPIKEHMVPRLKESAGAA
jgi:predicted MFS family arabinose efflux permease